MKKIFLILVLLLWFHPANADVCYDVSEAVAKKAVKILNDKKEIYEYCSICDNEEPQKIVIKDIKEGNPIEVNGKGIDLAHTYYEEGKQFINLGVASGCISDDEHGIKEKVDGLPVIRQTKDKAWGDAREQASNLYNKCVKQNESHKDNLTTAEMIVQNGMVNNCLSVAIKSEINKGFDDEMKNRMYSYLEEARKNIFKLYEGIYSGNKYCMGQCGTISLLIPYVDENDLLMKILERLLYLNIIKNGY